VTHLAHLRFRRPSPAEQTREHLREREVMGADTGSSAFNAAAYTSGVIEYHRRHVTWRGSFRLAPLRAL
jgi:hypothetical protein